MQLCMDTSSVASSALSPESTVTSLLSRSGHLRSSLVVPEHNTTFRYRDQDYDSASAALDAYIADFENCCHDPKLLPTSSIGSRCSPSKSKLRTLRNRDVLRERLTETELDFLNLPLSSLRHRVNRDRLSMTTDELLSIPHDGSMPVTHTSAFLQGLLDQSGASQSQHHLRCSTTTQKNYDRLTGSHTFLTPNKHRPRPGGGASVRRSSAALKPQVNFSSLSYHQEPDCTAGSQRAQLAASLHLPHWFTSNRSEMGCSGLSSVPDLKYPAWVQHCGLGNSPVPTERGGWEEWQEQGCYPSAAPASGVPSWVAELEDDYERAHAESQQTLRDLRLQFAEQISLLATKKKESDTIETLFRDNRIESLIQKADQVLSSLSQRADGELCPAGSAKSSTPPQTPVSLKGGAKGDLSPANTEDLKLFSSPLHSVTMDSVSAAGGDREALADTGSQARRLLSDEGSSVWKQPGPAEALKQMLFRLQAVEAELQRQQLSPGTSEANQTFRVKENPLLTNKPEAGEDIESSPGGPSLQRALLHLGRLKKLVEEPRDRDREVEGEERGEEEEKDEDEGHYSSSSSERLTCIQRKSSR